ncbi:hypothetical protein EYF80_061588 [Liparis tanakae]|uniref:Uncharacterized protein n=1 Tax=Liparis tanakae TaxID=230148 RepID=A0A4Z2EH76_9TELE|nr:hypothetical protein EYF80_061588 [Liparis tanakae]
MRSGEDRGEKRRVLSVSVGPVLGALKVSGGSGFSGRGLEGLRPSPRRHKPKTAEPNRPSRGLHSSNPDPPQGVSRLKDGFHTGGQAGGRSHGLEGGASDGVELLHQPFQTGHLLREVVLLVHLETAGRSRDHEHHLHWF